MDGTRAAVGKALSSGHWRAVQALPSRRRCWTRVDIREQGLVKPRVRVYRNPANRWLVLGILAVGLVLLVAGGLDAPKPGGPSREDNLAFAALLAATLVVLGYWRCCRAGLYPRDRHVLVVNVYRTYRVPWSEIESFSVGPSPSERRVVILERVDGTTIPISATAGWAPFMGKRLAHAPDPIAEYLNALLREHRRASPPPAGDRSFLQPAATEDATTRT
jgi:Bacterial PH domain